MKVWEETWEALDGWVVAQARDTNKNVALAADRRIGYEADAKLMAAAPDMARVLLAVEWGGLTDPCAHVCPACGRSEHTPDCALDAALRKAGVRPVQSPDQSPDSPGSDEATAGTVPAKRSV
jgi:hypothetical protein